MPTRVTFETDRRGVSLETFLVARRRLIDSALERNLPAPPRCPDVLHEALRYSLLGGGKRLRPILALAAAEAILDNETEAHRLALPAACAIEMIHTYSLVHDDLPAMDDDGLRRGRPTSHVVFGEGMAILVGDGLLTEAFALLAREPADGTSSLAARKLATLGLIAEAAGIAGMVGGQAIDLDAARPHTSPQAQPTTGASGMQRSFDEASLRDMHARKTGALIRASAVAGATMAGADAHALEAVAAFGTEIGLAFQIVDDVLDVEGDAAALGKAVGKDAAAGKPTYPALLGLDASKGLARDALERGITALAAVGISGRLPEIARWVLHRES
jgi:geranylgeranyl diphosphate synthase, type II